MVEKAIEDLLSEKNCVIIPQFGALMTKTKCASIRPESQEIKPPRVEVVFNKELCTNDGILAQRLAEYEKLSFVKALQKLQSTVWAWQAELAKGRTLEFSGIGAFTLAQDGTIQFESRFHQTIRTDTFGLKSVNLTPVKRSHRPSPRTPQKTGSKSKQKRVKPSPFLLVPLSIFITAMLLAVGLNVPIYQSIDNTVSSLAPLQNMVVANAENPNTKAKATSAPPKNASSGKTGSGADSTVQYHVISGSFKHLPNAQKRAADLEKSGFEPAIITSEKGFHRVSAERYADSGQAMQVVKNFEKAKQQPGAWLLKTTQERNAK